MMAPSPEAYHACRRDLTLVIRSGLLIAFVLLLVSLVVYTYHYSGEGEAGLVGTNPIENYLSVPGLIDGLLALHVEAFMTLAIVVLALTPVAGVFTGLYHMHRRGDRELAMISTTVFILLMLGLFVIGPLLK